MTGKSMLKKNKYENDYPKEVEAAWYVLKNFFNSLDCSEKRPIHCKNNEGKTPQKNYGVYPMNDNATLASILSGENRYRPSYMSKSLLHQHLMQIRTFYYRSNYNAIYREGYGSHDSQALNLPFSQDLNITHKVVRYEGRYILLLGIDIDAHNGEGDVEKVQNWLQNTYFLESYWEPSTSGSGRHGYIKLAYPDDIHLTYVISVLKELFSFLEKKRKQLGFKAKIDLPCGLPSTLSLVDYNPYPEEETDEDEGIIIPCNPSVLCCDYNPDTPIGGIIVSSSCSSPSVGDISNSNSSLGPVNGKYIKISRSQALKFPRFNNSNHNQCNMEDIKSLYIQRYYCFSYFQKLLCRLRDEENENSNWGKKNKNKRTSSRLGPTIVRSPQVNESMKNTHADTVEWSEIANTEEKTFDINDYWAKKKRTSGTFNYHLRIKELSSIDDVLLKTRKFYWYYTLYRREVPTVEEAMTEYIQQGLNSSDVSKSKKREKRFKSCRQFIENRFDLSKCGFHMDDWDNKKTNYVNTVSGQITEETDLTWNKGKEKTYKISIEELAVVYYAICKSNDYDENSSDSQVRNSFSYKMIQKVFQVVYGKGCHRAKCARILKILELELIEKIGNYVAGLRGNCYRAKGA